MDNNENFQVLIHKTSNDNDNDDDDDDDNDDNDTLGPIVNGKTGKNVSSIVKW